MYNVHVIIKYNIYSGCFVHNHIGMNKLLRKIVFTDMAIRGMPGRLINNTWLAVCAQKNWDVILRVWQSASKEIRDVI